jgi:hypothetical protein
MDTEEIIKKNFLGPGALVKFAGDPKEYTIRNISADRKGLFVTLNGLQVYYKPISKLIQVNRKPIRENKMSNNNILLEKQSIEDMQQELSRLEANLQARYNDYNDDDFWVNLSPEVKKLWKAKTYDLENEIQKLKKRIQRASLKEESNDPEIDYITGGLSDNLTIEDIAKKWTAEYYDIENLLPELEKQLKKGIEIEMEHTNDPNIAKEIALDHLMENPKYYDQLETIESDKKEKNIDIENKVTLKSQLNTLIEQLEALLINSDINLETEQKQNITVALDKLKETRDTCENTIDTFINTQKEVLNDNKKELTNEQIIEKFFEEILKENSNCLLKSSSQEDELIITEEIAESGYYTTNSSEVYKLQNNDKEHIIVLNFENIYDLTPQQPVLDSKILSNITVNDTPIDPQLIIVGDYKDLFQQVLEKLNCVI